MINRHLNPRASGLIVFGGGSGEGYSEGGVAEQKPIFDFSNFGQDNPFTLQDTLKQLKHIQGLREFSPEELAKYDLNGDGIVDLNDINAGKVHISGGDPDEAFRNSNPGILQNFKSAVNSAAAQTGGDGVDKIGGLGLALQAVQGVAVPTFEGDDAATFTEQATSHKASKVESLNSSLLKAQTQRSAEVASGARTATGTAISDPTALATQADVSKINPTETGTLISTTAGQLSPGTPYTPFPIRQEGDAAADPRALVPVEVGNKMPGMGQPDYNMTANTVDTVDEVAAPAEISATGVTAATGQSAIAEAIGGVERDYKPVGAIEAGFTPPPPGSINTMATESFHNPTTGESVVVNSGGYKVPDGWVKGSATGKFKTEGAQAAQGEVSAAGVAQAVTTDPTKTGVMDLSAAKGTATVMSNPVQREIQAGELISGVADATKAAEFTEQIQAATATPSDKATVTGQLNTLMQDFEGGNTPAWASGAMRNATAQMAARGLGSSSMAGQAIVQAAMESALPIAMADAQTQAQFESQNLSNRQARAMLGAQQRAEFLGMEFDQAFQSRVQNSARIADVANLNFTAEQSIALENSRTANTIDLANLSNSQATVMAQAASISQLESQNLSNQQQAAVQNAQAFLQMDMSNLNNRQQTEMFKTQTIAQSILTDQAAENAARQFNASSDNQTKQFMASITTQVNQFNSNQINATNQFNAGQENAASQFNANIENARDQFNAANALVVAQANAQWRQNTATLNTAAQNESNANLALSANAFTQSTMDQLWQRERDVMDYVYKASESSKDRALSIVLADKKYDEYEKARNDAEETSKWSTLTQILLS